MSWRMYGGSAASASRRIRFAQTRPALDDDPVAHRRHRVDQRDSQWRDESWPRLLLRSRTIPSDRASPRFGVRRAGGDIPRWTPWRPPTGTGAPGADAHARLGLSGESEPPEEKRRMSVPLPATSRSLHLHRARRHRGPAVGSADDDASQVVAGLRRGQVYSVIDACRPRPVRVHRDTRRPGRADGDTIGTDGPIGWHARVAGPKAPRSSCYATGES